MFRFHGSKNHVREERNNSALKATVEVSKRDTSLTSHGPSHRPLQMQQQHQQQHNSENMVTLHARLLQEAEKIRKWKVQTELDLKEKERKMTEASLRLETMKKSILELQLQNEKTSSKLEEEIANKGEVMKRIDATREMCNLLKSHASSVLERLTRCETERTELKYTRKDQLQQFQDLTTKFKNLQIQVVEDGQRSKFQADMERQDQLQREEALRANLDISEKQIQSLNDILRKKTEEAHSYEVQLQDRETDLETLKMSVDSLQENVSGLSKELETREIELRDSALRIVAVQEEKGSLEKKVQGLELDLSTLQTSKDDLALQMTEVTSNLEQQLKGAQDQNNIITAKLEAEQQRLSECTTELLKSKQAFENLETARDKLLMEKKDADINEDMLKFQISNLISEKEENKEEIHNLNGEIAVLQKKLDREILCKSQAQDDSEALQGKISALELERHDMKEQINSLQVELISLKTKAESLESKLLEEEDKQIKFQTDIEHLEKNLDLKRERIQQLEVEYEQCSKELGDKSDALIQMETRLDSSLKHLETIKGEKEELEEKLTSSEAGMKELRATLKGYEERIEELTCQLSDLSEQQKESGKHFTTQQKKAAATTKLNKELEKEVKTLKVDLEKERQVTGQRLEELNAIQEELSALRKTQTDSEDCMQRYKEEMSQLKHQCEHDQREAKIAMEKATDMQLRAEKERENAKALTECQLAEMMSTLETYKQNNEKLISEKDLEMEAMRAQIQDKKWTDMKYSEEKKEFQEEIQKLKKQITMFEKEKESLVKEVASTSAEKTKLQEQGNEVNILKKDALNKTQEPQVHTPSKKVKDHHSPPVVQVTPQQQQPHTPLVLVTPKISTVPKTPSRSILRVVNSETKRRKVAFTPCNKSPSSSEESDLMELDPEAALSAKSCTPLLFTPTSKAEKPAMLESKPTSSKSVPLNRKPRGPPTTKVTEALKSPAIRKAPTRRVEPQAQASLPIDHVYECPKTAHIRKTPAKKTSKFFSVSPRNKSVESKSKGKGEAKDISHMAWFEMDSVYGFGPED